MSVSPGRRPGRVRRRALQAEPRESAQRLAVQRCGRRQAGAAILRRCPCGDHISLQRLVGQPIGMAARADQPERRGC